jgi:uncharacterized protein YegP (UPF0339 family)
MAGNHDTNLDREQYRFAEREENGLKRLKRNSETALLNSEFG